MRCLKLKIIKFNKMVTRQKMSKDKGVIKEGKEEEEEAGEEDLTKKDKGSLTKNLLLSQSTNSKNLNKMLKTQTHLRILNPRLDNSKERK